MSQFQATATGTDGESYNITINDLNEFFQASPDDTITVNEVDLSSGDEHVTFVRKADVTLVAIAAVGTMDFAGPACTCFNECPRHGG